MNDYLFSAAGKAYLLREYAAAERSTYDIAKERGTYANLVRRALLHHGILPRSHADAQRAALKSGRLRHPTEGKPRCEETRRRIGDGVSLSWEKDRAERAGAARVRWAAMPEAGRERLRRAASEGVRRAAAGGSALENFLASGLAARHRVHTRTNDSDILLPLARVAVLVDGPAHFLPIWGETRLARVTESDRLRTRDLLAAGFSVVRVKCLADSVSATRMRRALTKLLSVLDSMLENHSPPVAEIEV